MSLFSTSRVLRPAFPAGTVWAMEEEAPFPRVSWQAPVTVALGQALGERASVVPLPGFTQPRPSHCPGSQHHSPANSTSAWQLLEALMLFELHRQEFMSCIGPDIGSSTLSEPGGLRWAGGLWAHRRKEHIWEDLPPSSAWWTPMRKSKGTGRTHSSFSACYFRVIYHVLRRLEPRAGSKCQVGSLEAQFLPDYSGYSVVFGSPQW